MAAPSGDLKPGSADWNRLVSPAFTYNPTGKKGFAYLKQLVNNLQGQWAAKTARAAHQKLPERERIDNAVLATKIQHNIGDLLARLQQLQNAPVVAGEEHPIIKLRALIAEASATRDVYRDFINKTGIQPEGIQVGEDLVPVGDALDVCFSKAWDIAEAEGGEIYLLIQRDGIESDIKSYDERLKSYLLTEEIVPLCSSIVRQQQEVESLRNQGINVGNLGEKLDAIKNQLPEHLTYRFEKERGGAAQLPQKRALELQSMSKRVNEIATAATHLKKNRIDVEGLISKIGPLSQQLSVNLILAQKKEELGRKLDQFKLNSDDQSLRAAISDEIDNMKRSKEGSSDPDVQKISYQFSQLCTEADVKELQGKLEIALKDLNSFEFDIGKQISHLERRLGVDVTQLNKQFEQWKLDKLEKQVDDELKKLEANPTLNDVLVRNLGWITSNIKKLRSSGVDVGGFNSRFDQVKQVTTKKISEEIEAMKGTLAEASERFSQLFPSAALETAPSVEQQVDVSSTPPEENRTKLLELAAQASTIARALLILEGASQYVGGESSKLSGTGLRDVKAVLQILDNNIDKKFKEVTEQIKQRATQQAIQYKNELKQLNAEISGLNSFTGYSESKASQLTERLGVIIQALSEEARNLDEIHSPEEEIEPLEDLRRAVGIARDQIEQIRKKMQQATSGEAKVLDSIGSNFDTFAKDIPQPWSETLTAKMEAWNKLDLKNQDPKNIRANLLVAAELSDVITNELRLKGIWTMESKKPVWKNEALRQTGVALQRALKPYGTAIAAERTRQSLEVLLEEMRRTGEKPVATLLLNTVAGWIELVWKQPDNPGGRKSVNAIWKAINKELVTKGLATKSGSAIIVPNANLRLLLQNFGKAVTAYRDFFPAAAPKAKPVQPPA